LGIFVPAVILAAYQINSKLETQVDIRVRAPMQQQADVLSRSLGMAIWNVDQGAAAELVDAVIRNPDVVRVTVVDEYQQVFASKEASVPTTGTALAVDREIVHNGTRVGRLRVELTTARIQRELVADLAKLGMALAAQVGISFGLIWLLFDQRLMRPLKRLQTSAERLARGELLEPLEWTRQDEMGSLAQGLESMRSNLVLSIGERDQKNLALENELVARQRIEEALSLSQAKFEAIFDASPVAMSVSKIGETVALADVNSAWTRLFLRARADMIGTVGTSNGTWRDQADRTAVLNAIQNKGAIARYPAWMLRGGGLPDMLCEVSGSRISIGAQSLMIVAYDDITAKHQSEQEILQLNATLENRVAERTQELTNTLNQLTAAQAELVRSEKMSALGAMVAGIAHELNTPIGNSLTVASTLQDNTNSFKAAMGQGLTRSRLDEYVSGTDQGAGILLRSLHHAAELVSSFKQVAVDQTSVNRRVFRLKDTLNEILLTMGPTLRKTTHAVECNVSDDITMDSFPGPFGQVITNLINNALLHAFEGRQNGRITITAAITVPGWVEVKVSDDGAGIPEAHLAKVFDPFFTTKLGKGGSGLGLNIVYNLITTTLGGRVQVNSQMGQGATFTLMLPLRMG
jgi:signal transduction histidine kinase